MIFIILLNLALFGTASHVPAFQPLQKPIFETPPDHDSLPNPIPPPQPPYYQRYDMVISKVQETHRKCFYAQECPAQAVCYMNQCYCQVGYQYINQTNQCWRKNCDPFLSDCGYYFPNSECVSSEQTYSPGLSGHCVCLYSFTVNSFALSCQDLYQITPTYVWRKVLGYLTLTLFLPVLAAILVLLILIWIVYLLVREFGKKREDKEKKRNHSVDTDDDCAFTTRSFELEPMNREPRRPESVKSSNASLNRNQAPIPVTTKVFKYFKNTEIRGSSSPV